MAIGTGTAILAGTLGAAAIGASASRSAGKTQAQAAAESGNLQREIFERQVELQQPWLKAGEEALNRLRPLAMEYTPFGAQQFQQDPGYQFRMSEGMKALERGAAARGGLLSGATLRGTQRFGQELASQEYQNAFNRYQAERQARLGPLQSLAGVGQTTAQGVASQAGTMGANMGQAMQAGAAARASGYVGQANALTGALSTGLNFYQGQQMLNALQPRAFNVGGSGVFTTPGSQQSNMLAQQWS
jgi:hypothetical protein